MKHITKSCLALAVTLTLTLVFWPSVHAESNDPAEMKMNGKMMEHCQEMMAQKQKMAEDMNAQNTALSEHVVKMNSTPDDKKMAEMAALITHMVEQKIAMDTRRALMEEEMKEHMMEHKHMGMRGIMNCPMMKGMNDMDEKSDEPEADQK